LLPCPEIKANENQMNNNWKQQPDSNGWWLWREGGRAKDDVLLLLVGDGSEIASDDEWECSAGFPPQKPWDDVFHRNYWEGTETTQEMMPGLWIKTDRKPIQIT